MSTEGTMAEIRALLDQGWSAPDIINQGYASSTVYRLQQQFRKRQPQNGQSPHSADSPPRNTEARDTEALLLRLERMEGLVAQLQARLQRQERSTAGLQDLHDAVEQLQQDLSLESHTRANLQTLLQQINTELDDLAQLYRDDVIFGQPKWRRRAG